MKTRYRLFKRRGRIFYCFDNITQRYASLQTRNRDEARLIVEAKNLALRQPTLSREIGKAYLATSDPKITSRTWQDALDILIETKQGPTRERWLRAAREKSLDRIRHSVIIETQAEHFLQVLKSGGVSTNVHLRKLHNFCLDMNWLPVGVLPKKQWPKIKFKEKRAITLEEHRRILAAETNPERRAFYAVAWHLGAPSEEPTEVELVFSPAWPGESFRELRVLRRWYFAAGNKPKQGDSFETLEIHVADDRYPDGRPLAFDDMEDAHHKLERRLFPAHLTPAFLFDGEQAAELIESMGDGGLRKAVEVMFGTTLLEETVDQLQAFISRTSQKGASKRKASELEEERDGLERENAESNRTRSKLQQQREELTTGKDERERQREEIKRQLAASGGVSAGSPEALQTVVEHAEREFAQKRRALAENLSSAGLALAASRFSEVLLLQLDKEHLREEWERVRDATLTRKDAVLDIAMPEPPEKDPLIGNLASHVREELKQRFILAIDAIYHPPDPQMAKGYMLGHVKGDEARERLRGHIADANNGLAVDLKRYGREYREATSALDDANDRLRLAKNRPSEQGRLLHELETLNQEIQSAERRMGELNSQIDATKAEMERRNKRLGEIREKLKDMGPDQMRVAIADRAKRAFETFADRLRETSAKRLEEVVTEIGIAWNPYKRVIIHKNGLLLRNLLLKRAQAPLEPRDYPLEEEYREALGDENI